MFRIGQKVVCINDKMSRGLFSYGEVYTITNMRTGRFSNEAETTTGLKLAEISLAALDWARADRFRPAVDNKQDISIFTKMLKPQDQKEDA